MCADLEMLRTRTMLGIPPVEVAVLPLAAAPTVTTVPVVDRGAVLTTTRKGRGVQPRISALLVLIDHSGGKDTSGI